MISFMTEQVTIIEPVMVNDRGTMVPDWAQPPSSEITVTGCSIQPGTSDEDQAGRQNVVTRWSAYLPPATVVTAYSKIMWMGNAYAVDGTPQVWSSPTGMLSHIAVQLIDWRG